MMPAPDFLTLSRTDLRCVLSGFPEVLVSIAVASDVGSHPFLFSLACITELSDSIS